MRTFTCLDSFILGLLSSIHLILKRKSFFEAADYWRFERFIMLLIKIPEILEHFHLILLVIVRGALERFVTLVMVVQVNAVFDTVRDLEFDVFC